MMWILLVLVFAILVAGFLMKGLPTKPAGKGCNSCPKSKKQDEW
jgi:hypothetical protein